MKTIKHLCLVICLGIILPRLQAQDEDVMFQAFDWNVQNQPAGQTWYDVVMNNSATIKDAGLDLIWMPPPSDAASAQGYLPRELYNLNSNYGTETQLRNLINQYHSLDIKVISDIVINHRVGTNDAVTFTNPAWPTYYITAEDEGRNYVDYDVTFSSNYDYYPGTSLKADGSDGTYAAARDLDHQNPEVRQEIKNWMNYLKNDVGFDGWRYDFVHGYDPIYNKEYNDATSPYFAVGELLESSRVQTNNWVSYTQQSSSAFDFNTKVTLQNAIRDNNFSYLRDGNGNPSGMIGVNPAKSVTFLDNHDTGEAQQCCGSNYVFPGGETNLRKGYAYILTHPGNPMVFWTHFFDTGSGVRDAIKDLISARKSVRIFASSSISIAESRNDLYAAYIDGRNGTLAMKLGSGNWSPDGSNWVLKSSGTDYAVWTQGGDDDDDDDDSTTDVEPFTVNFKKPSGWGNTINVYFYDTSTGSTIPGIASWPGESMTNSTGTPWYSYQFSPPSDIAANDIRLIFNDGTNQTDDLARSTNGWFDNGTWTNTCPSDCDSTTDPTDDISFTLNFKKPSSWSSSINVYFYNASTDTTITGTANWPGESMTNNTGTAWYGYQLTLPSGVAASDVRLIFNDGTNQTDDLARGSDGWYDNGTWTNTCPSDCNNDSDSDSDTVTYNFLRTSSWGDTINIYLYNTETNATLANTNAWPGSIMNNGNSWSDFTVTIPSGVSENNIGVVFNNNNGEQTVDLTRGTSGWFTITGSSDGKATGTWSDTCPSNCNAGKRLDTTYNNAYVVSPNPIVNNANLNITLSTSGLLEVIIINMLGQETIAYQQQRTKGHHTISLNGHHFTSNGIYVCRVTLDGKPIAKPVKMIKQ